MMGEESSWTSCLLTKIRSERMAPTYSLIHIVNGEFHTPLLESQVFERAFWQSKIGGRCHAVSVFVFEPLSTIVKNKYFRRRRELATRFSGVKIALLPFSSRVGIKVTLAFVRLFLQTGNQRPNIFHCRGVEAMKLALYLRLPSDKILLDVRGYDPIEFFAARGFFDPQEFDETQKVNYGKLESKLKSELARADQVITVSAPLASHLQTHFDLPHPVKVIPCAGPSIVPKQRGRVEHELNFVYLGGTQSYQYLRELVIPFSHALIQTINNCRVHFVSHEKQLIEKMVEDLGFQNPRMIFASLAHHEVRNYIAGMDLGLLLRAPSLMNSFAQPVKVGEYLAAGMGVVFHQGTGDLADILLPRKLGVEVNLWRRNTAGFLAEAMKVKDFCTSFRADLSTRATTFASGEYCWRAVAPSERKLYDALM